jgi:asparagine synthase (glutamine-hydrolysing)
MSRLARESATVALSGEGADEVFGGYHRQRYDVAIDRLGGVARRLLPTALRLMGRRPSPRLVRRLTMPSGIARQLDWGRVLTADVIDRMMTGANEAETLGLHHDLAERWHALAARDPLNARLMGDREVFLAADLLPKVDRMSMAHSLEVRVPYLGNEVVDLVLPLPGRFKAGLRRDKRLLRAVARDVLPPALAERPKRGFEVPIGAWLRGALRPALEDRLAATELNRSGVLRPTPVTAMVAEHLAGHADHGRALWTLLVVQSFLVRAAIAG